MHEKTIAIIDEIFDEVAEQFFYLKNRKSITDPRFACYLTFINSIIDTFYLQERFTVPIVQKSIESLHIDVWLNTLFTSGNHYQNNDEKWMLLHLEKRLLDSTSIYEKFWTDFEIQERYMQSIIQILKNSQFPIEKGSLWKIKGQLFIACAPFAFDTDVWFRLVDDLNSPIQFSYRLSDFAPLSSADLTFMFPAFDMKV